MRENRTSVLPVIICGVIAFAIAFTFTHWRSQSHRHSTISASGAQAPGPLRNWPSRVQQDSRTIRNEDAAQAVDATPAISPLGPAATDVPIALTSQAGDVSSILPPPDLGLEFIPEQLQSTIKKYDQSMQSRGMEFRGIKSQFEYWSERKKELDQETPDQWSREMEARLGEFFESLPEAPAMRVDIACRPSQCVLRIADTLSASDLFSFRVGAMTIDPGSSDIHGIMWRLVGQPWFKANLAPGSNQMHFTEDSRYHFSLLRFVRKRKQV